MQKVTSDDIWVYVNFVGNSLRAAMPGCDKYYRENKRTIELVAEHMKRIQVVHRIKPLYRGLLLEKEWDEQTLLPPNPKMQFLSFSEDREIALRFANPYNEYAIGFQLRGKKVSGFLIEYTPTLDEILFHHSWIPILKIDQLFERQYGDIGELFIQKEVMLKQEMKYFNMERVKN